ncbi:hypothetical protein EDE12_11425 [Methylosinus sp. sav-2]|uniref:hypothetical protein n=1 Tax=Methylosinus sp. sav-2 TaxID=2485168 RepID=UPI00047905F3|nr:hypothetical protein [Methylosinus sp. sav-2]TDX61488.1 hypothetical protein EDE12_11425 [Methylosinus sp. sav-2]
MDRVDTRNAIFEDEFVGSFIVDSRKRRWRDALAEPKNRRKLLGGLNHPRYEVFCCAKLPLKSIGDAIDHIEERLYIMADSAKADTLMVDFQSFGSLFDAGVLSGSIALIDSNRAILISEDAITLLYG